MLSLFQLKVNDFWGSYGLVSLTSLLAIWNLDLGHILQSPFFGFGISKVLS